MIVSTTLLLALAVGARQDPPARPDADRRARIQKSERELEEEMAALRREIQSLPSDSPLRQEKLLRMNMVELELLSRRRPGPNEAPPPRERRAGGVPEPPPPPPPPGAERNRGPLRGELEDVRGWLRENEPETFRRVSQLEEQGRAREAQEQLMMAQGRMRSWAEMKERDPEGFERLGKMRQMERESLDLADQARRAPPEERPALSERLKELLGRLFEAREEVRARELAEMKRRVEEIEKSLAGRRAAKDKIVERRRRELLGEKSDDEW
jgi:hypothetical protein